MNLPKIGITLGDPGGIGPEIVLKTLSLKDSLPRAQYIIFGSSFVLEEGKLAMGLKMEIQTFDKKKSISPSLFEIENSLETLKKGSSLKENGEASFLFFSKKQKEEQSMPLSQHRYQKIPGILQDLDGPAIQNSSPKPILMP